MKNFGTAKVKVEFLASLPGIDPHPGTFNVDISADAVQYTKEAGKLRPTYVEQISNKSTKKDGDAGFTALFPKRQKFMVDNKVTNINGYWDVSQFVGQSSPPEYSPPKPVITWTPVLISDSQIPTAITAKISGTNPTWPTYDLIQPDNYPVLEPTDSTKIKCPVWEDVLVKSDTMPNYYKEYVSTFSSFLGDANNAAAAEFASAYTPLDSASNVYVIRQNNAHDGLWWAVESSDFLNTNMPFWVVINRDSPPPSQLNKEPHETCFIISLGLGSGSGKDRFDLEISNNNVARLYDYRYYTSGTNPGEDTELAASANELVSPVTYDFDTEGTDLARILKEENPLEIGFMTVAGRLVIYINKNITIYTRTNSTQNNSTTTTGSSSTATQATNDNVDESFEPCQIKEGKIRIFGTNVAATMYVAPMTFAPTAAAFFDVADLAWNTVDQNYHPINSSGETMTGTVNRIPKSSVDHSAGSGYTNNDTISGSDCATFVDGNGSDTVRPVNMETADKAYHYQGRIEFKKLTSIGTLVSDLNGSNYYALIFYASPMTFKYYNSLSVGSSGSLNTVNTKYYFFSGCPYFFKLKGRAIVPPVDNSPASLDATNDVISVSENSTPDGYFAIKSTANVTLYNKGGTYDFLRNKQKGLRITWGWTDYSGVYKSKRTFTGLVVSATSTSIAGKETIILNCEDYMHILNHKYIVNSPIYDGMLGKSVIADLAKVCGIRNINYSWDNDFEYFCPSGYSFTNPIMKFKCGERIYDSMITVLKKFVAHIYFDGDGELHIGFLPGGLLSEPDPAPTYSLFTTNPLTYSDTINIITDEKTIETTFESTVNQIIGMSVDRLTGALIVLSTSSASSPQIPADLIPFQKVFLFDEPAYGDKSAFNQAVQAYKKRLFYPIVKMSFKTVGSSTIIDVLSFVKVDDIPFRLVSVKREFNAENNTFEQNYECEWLGGSINSGTTTSAPI